MKTGKISTVEQGNDFRDRVAALLKAAHFEKVETDRRIGHKKVDVYFEEKTLLQRKRIAVECKDHGKPLTKEFIKAEIYSDYAPLLEQGLVESILIISPLPLNADAATYIGLATGFAFKTFSELQNEVMDFEAYLQVMRAQFHEEGLDTYYVKLALDDGSDLEDRFKKWLEDTGSQPLAILAGYGMGKSTFAKRVASFTANERSKSDTVRVPILIRLGEIANEQGLEGLLGKAFTTVNVVGNYNFELFMALNAAGRFLIILDGFDEMKHAMSWEHFRYNFSQLNRLVVSNSKVLLLGRPSAFLSESEHYCRASRQLGQNG